jgi:hypothetical protein
MQVVISQLGLIHTVLLRKSAKVGMADRRFLRVPIYRELV